MDLIHNANANLAMFQMPKAVPAIETVQHKMPTRNWFPLLHPSASAYLVTVPTPTIATSVKKTANKWTLTHS